MSRPRANFGQPCLVSFIFFSKTEQKLLQFVLLQLEPLCPSFWSGMATPHWPPRRRTWLCGSEEMTCFSFHGAFRRADQGAHHGNALGHPLFQLQFCHIERDGLQMSEKLLVLLFFSQSSTCNLFFLNRSKTMFRHEARSVFMHETKIKRTPGSVFLISMRNWDVYGRDHDQ